MPSVSCPRAALSACRAQVVLSQKTVSSQRMARRLTKREARRMAALRKRHGARTGPPVEAGPMPEMRRSLPLDARGTGALRRETAA